MTYTKKGGDKMTEKDLMLQDMRRENAELRARVPKWISVDDRLPEEDGYYLCCIKSSLFPDRVYIDILECDKGSFEEGHIYTDTVTHWMSLPKLPKGE